MVRCRKEVDFESKFSKIVKDGIRSDKIVVVGMSDSKGHAIMAFFHKGSSKSYVKKVRKRVQNVIRLESKYDIPLQNRAVFFSESLKPEDFVKFIGKHRELRSTSAFKPYIVLLALTDSTQFNRGTGGKSSSAIRKYLWAEGMFLSIQEIESSLSFLRDINVVVKSITGAWWPKIWLREVMREQGFSYLPTIK